ncbi:MAG: hypothetical protein Q4G59_04075 [Planctomycetia bacterium]|nr:hypothetical protein [Planctomycetia bacterium]
MNSINFPSHWEKIDHINHDLHSCNNFVIGTFSFSSPFETMKEGRPLGDLTGNHVSGFVFLLLFQM